MKQKEKKKVVRPAKIWPEKIDATPEEIARVLLTTPPKRVHEWNFMKEEEKES